MILFKILTGALCGYTAFYALLGLYVKSLNRDWEEKDEMALRRFITIFLITLADLIYL